MYRRRCQSWGVRAARSRVRRDVRWCARGTSSPHRPSDRRSRRRILRCRGTKHSKPSHQGLCPEGKEAHRTERNKGQTRRPTPVSAFALTTIPQPLRRLAGSPGRVGCLDRLSGAVRGRHPGKARLPRPQPLSVALTRRPRIALSFYSQGRH